MNSSPRLFNIEELLEFLSGVENFKGSEHSDYMKLFVLGNIGKVLETYNTLISNSVVGNDVEMLDYKF